jgi:hypothetical protein
MLVRMLAHRDRLTGLIVSYPLRDSIAEVLLNCPNPEVDVIVVTDSWTASCRQ